MTKKTDSHDAQVTFGLKDAFVEAARKGDYTAEPLAQMKHDLEERKATWGAVFEEAKKESHMRRIFVAALNGEDNAKQLEQALQQNPAIEYAHVSGSRQTKLPKQGRS